MCSGIFQVIDGWVLGCPYRLIPEWGVCLYLLIGTFDSSKGTIVAAVGPVWKPHVQFPVFCVSVEDTWLLDIYLLFMIAVLTHVFWERVKRDLNKNVWKFLFIK